MGSEEYQIKGGNMKCLDLLQNILQQYQLLTECDDQCMKTM